MRYLLSLGLYYIGDVISRTIMMWGNGYGYSVYRQVMLWSCNLDKDGKIWKYVKPKAKKSKNKKK
jgi:hypothetical protein